MPVIVPFQIEIAPGACDELEFANTSAGSAGIGKEEPPPEHGEMPEHASALASVRL